MEKFRAIVVIVLCLATVTAASAQGGCVNSPECPTVLLGAVGFLSATIVHFRRR